MSESRKAQAKEPANDEIEVRVMTEDPLAAEDPAAETAPGTQEGGREEGERYRDLERALAEAQNEAKENYDRMLRASAEMENFKKRIAREMTDFKKYANESLIRALLPVVDNLELAIQSSSQDEHCNSQVVEGVTLTLAELTKVLEGFGVKAVSAEGQPFDPKYHQAFVQEENDKLPENTVIKEFQKGYLLHERLIRPAMVIVSKKSGAEKGAD